MSISRLYYNEEYVDTFLASPECLSMALCECHYMYHDCFLAPNQLLQHVDRVRSIPCAIVHGQNDIVCTPRSAWMLHQAWPESELYIVPASGHSCMEPGIIEQLVCLTNKYVE